MRLARQPVLPLDADIGELAHASALDAEENLSARMLEQAKMIFGTMTRHSGYL